MFPSGVISLPVEWILTRHLAGRAATALSLCCHPLARRRFDIGDPQMGRTRPASLAADPGLPLWSAQSRDVKFRPGSPAGLKIQAWPDFLRNPGYWCRVYARLGRSDSNVLCVGCRASWGTYLKDADWS